MILPSCSSERYRRSFGASCGEYVFINVYIHPARQKEVSHIPTCLLALSTSLRVAICSRLVLSNDLSFRISSMQLSLSLSRRGASSLAAALCLESCRDLSTARWRCFTWERRQTVQKTNINSERKGDHNWKSLKNPLSYSVIFSLISRVRWQRERKGGQ